MKTRWGTFFLLAFAAQTASAQTYTIDTKSSQAFFIAKGKPGFLKIEGEGAEVSGTIAKTDKGWSGVVEANLLPIKTGIDLRDEHMHEKYLETGKYPKALLKITKVTLSEDQSECSFAGILTIKAKDGMVEGSCEVKTLSPAEIQAEVAFEFDLEKYPVGVPSYLGVTVASSVKVETTFRAQAKNVH